VDNAVRRGALCEAKVLARDYKGSIQSTVDAIRESEAETTRQFKTVVPAASTALEKAIALFRVGLVPLGDDENGPARAALIKEGRALLTAIEGRFGQDWRGNGRAWKAGLSRGVSDQVWPMQIKLNSALQKGQEQSRAVQR